MAITKRPPNTIYLGGGLPGGEGGGTVVNEFVCGATPITPGMLIEKFNGKWRPHASATEVVAAIVAVEKIEWNQGVDAPYVENELLNAMHLRAGSTWWAIIPSGQDISKDEYLQSNGNGKLKSATATTAAAGVARFQSLDNLGAVVADTRCRVVVL